MKLLFLRVLLLYILFYIPIYAKTQVTIGSNIPPNKGALLDLKEKKSTNGSVNSDKGLMLPRVKLTILSPKTPDELSASIGGLGSWDLDTHIGLTVYNIYEDQCAANFIKKGTYVFDGTEWQLLGKKEYQQTELATNSNRSDWKAAWGTNVILHQEKIDTEGKIVYKQFYSADFGSAGRWMTTNLAAFKYDGAIYTGGDPLGRLNQHPTDVSNPHNKAWYSYPGSSRKITTNEQPTPEFIANPYIGLFYTWDAATAGKGGSTGRLNVDNLAIGNPANNESGFFPQGTNGGVNEEKQRQGVCPHGWHLPNDYEWTQLEQEIIKNTSNYANMSDINNSDPTDGGKVTHPTPGISGTANMRGTTHGTAMKSVCPPPNSAISTAGKSLSKDNNGFDILLVGYIRDGITNYYGSTAYFWSSSSYTTSANGTGAWQFYLRSDNGQVGRSNNFRYMTYPVRCKKND